MTLTAESNITQVIQNLKRRASAVKPEYSVLISNNVEYAVAQEYGWERTFIWAQMPLKQRFAILQKMKKKGGDSPELGVSGPEESASGRMTVTRFEGGFTLSLSPAGMMTKSIRPVKDYCQQDLKALNPGSELSVTAWLLDKAFFAQATLVNNTPVDQGRLAGAWEVNLVAV